MTHDASRVGVDPGGSKRTAGRPAHKQARTSLTFSAIVTLFLIGLLAASVALWGGSWTPKLGLDLEGGTQMVLQPQTAEGQEVNQQQLDQAVDIIRARVDGQGVAEAEVSTLGNNVVVAIPGRMTQQQEDALRASSQMAFRPVLGVLPTQSAQQADPAPTGEPAPPPEPSASVVPEPTQSPAPAEPSAEPAPPTPGASGSPAAAGRPPAAVTPTPAPGAPTASPPAESVAPPAPAEPGADTGLPTGESGPRVTDEIRSDPQQLVEVSTSEAWITPELQMQALQLDCTEEGAPRRADPDTATVACSEDGTAVYVLGPTVMDGNNIEDASAQPATNPQTGAPTGGHEIVLRVEPDYVQPYATISGYMVNLPEPRNQLASVLDNRVISAPYFSSAITGGQASISGDFAAEEAQALADQLKFGALPISFQVQNTENVSPTVGGDQLRNGLLAGLIGLVLVFAYFVWQYRVTGLVTVASVLLVALLTYVILTLFGWAYNLRLTMAGVTGAVVAIGTTADSFIVYFERVRDEARDGKRLPAAVQAGWARARRTILVSDGVNLLAAIVLYVLAASNVRGFAFMLIITTLLDLFVTFFFTHPLLTLLARTKFFAGGHPLSGFDDKTLGRDPLYKGRGRVRSAGGSTVLEGSPA